LLGQGRGGLGEASDGDHGGTGEQLVEQVGLQTFDAAEELVLVEQEVQDLVGFAARGPVRDQGQPQDVLEEGHAGEGAEQLAGPVLGADLVQALEVFGAQLVVLLVLAVLLRWLHLQQKQMIYWVHSFGLPSIVRRVKASDPQFLSRISIYSFLILHLHRCESKK